MFSMPNSDVDREILQMALVGYEAELEKIKGKISELQGGSNGRVKRSYTKRATVEASAPIPVEEAAPVRKRRRFSAATRKRMAESQKRRWSGLKATAAKDSTLKKVGKKKRLKLSAEERVRISGGQAKGTKNEVPF